MTVDLRQGDCLKVMRSLDDNSVDLILTDPPYFRVKGDAWDRQWNKPEGFLAWLDTVLIEYHRLLKPNGSLYLFASPQMSARVECLIAERFCVLNRIVWQKPKYSTKAEMFKKETMRTYFPASEYIVFAEHIGSESYAKGEAGYGAKCDELRGFVFEPLREYLDSERVRAGFSVRQVAEQYQKKTGSRTVTGMAGHWFTRIQWVLPTEENYDWLQSLFGFEMKPYEELRQQYEELRQQYEELRQQYEELRRPFSTTSELPYTDVWSYKTVQAYKGKHPCEKPLEMMQDMIQISSKPGAVVLDSFMGSGTTGVACEMMGRDFIGIEKDAEYFKIAKDRIESATSQLEIAV